MSKRFNIKSESINAYRNSLSFPIKLDENSLEDFVNHHKVLQEYINDFCHSLIMTEQKCKLMMAFTKFYEKLFMVEDWTMIVYQCNTVYKIAIINIKENVFAQTFSSLTTSELKDALNLNNYGVSYSIDTHSHRKELLLLGIHSCLKIGKCTSFQTKEQQNKRREEEYLQPCPYCDAIIDPMQSKDSIGRHVLPQHRDSIVCIASLLGLNEALTKVLSLRMENHHYGFVMNIFAREKGALKEYLNKLQRRHNTLISDSVEYWLSLHQIMVAKRG